MKEKILVTGATGHLGHLVIDHLLKKTVPEHVTALARDKDKAKSLSKQGIDVQIGDYNNKDSLVNAFSGVEKIYFVSSDDLEKRPQQHKNVIAAAEEAGVQHVVYTSFERKDESQDSPIYPVAKGHLAAEEALKNSPLTYTILRHNLYMDIIPMFVGENVLENGTIYLPTEQGQVAFMSRNDMAKIAAEVLTSKDHVGKTYNLSGNKAYSFSEIATIISEISGKDINYVSPKADEFKKTMEEHELPEPAIHMTLMFSKGIAHGEFSETAQNFKHLTGGEHTSLRQFLKEIYGKKS